MSFEFLDILTIIAIVPLLLFSLFFLFSSKTIKPTNRFLGLFLLILGLFTLNFFLIGFRNSLPDYFKYIFFIGYSLYFLLGPALFTYTKSVFGKRITLLTEIIHYSPFIVSLIYYLALYREFLEIFYIIRYAQIFIYMIISFRVVIQFKQSLKNHYSQIESIELNKFYVVLGIFFALWLIDILAITNYLFFNFSSEVNSSLAYLSMFITFLLPYLIIYNTLKNSGKKREINLYQTTYSGVDISENEANRYESLLKNYLLEKEPYLNSNLTLKNLATELNISPRIVSYIINAKLKKSFFDLINGMRIEEAKKLLADPENNSSILEICYDSGFNSKSAFNSAFKKFVGTTPSRYKTKLNF